jgi:hypothetical protein
MKTKNKYLVTTPSKEAIELSAAPTRKQALASVGCPTNKDWAELKAIGFSLVKIDQ